MCLQISPEGDSELSTLNWSSVGTPLLSTWWCLWGSGTKAVNCSWRLLLAGRLCCDATTWSESKAVSLGSRSAGKRSSDQHRIQRASWRDDAFQAQAMSCLVTTAGISEVQLLMHNS